MIKSDTSGIESAEENLLEEVKSKLSHLAHKGVEYSKKHGDYQNRSGNLRNAVGSAIVLGGEISDIYVPSDTGHEDAREKTVSLIKGDRGMENGIIIADGMEYASYVESKGYDVISGGALNIEKEGIKKFKE